MSCSPSGGTSGPAPRSRCRLALMPVLMALAARASGLAQAPARASTSSLGPDREALRPAYGTQVAAINAGAAEMSEPTAAAREQIELQDLQELSGRPIEREGVHDDCRVEVRIRLPGQRPQSRVVNLWLERTAEGWVSR